MAFKEAKKAAERKEKRKLRGPYARLSGLRMSPRKVRLVVDMIRGRRVEWALASLACCRRSAALPVAKLIRSAVANAAQREDGASRPSSYFIGTATVDEGRTLRRFLPRAKGRSTRIHKRTSHIQITLAPVMA
jgi:large subunit ribosomal protein L22